MNVAQFIPEVQGVEDVYPAESHAHQKERWDHLLAKFEEKYGKRASFISRAPGRVNIIGEVSQAPVRTAWASERCDG